MKSLHTYPVSLGSTISPVVHPCHLIEAVYSVGLGGCAGGNGLPPLSFQHEASLSNIRPSLDSGMNSSTTTLQCGGSSSSSSGSSIANKSSDTDSNEHDFDFAYHQFSRTAHMGILDPSYKVFTSRLGNGSVVYKIRNGIVVVGGDPLCTTSQIEPLLDEFRRFRSKHNLKFVYVGASAALAEYSQKHGGLTMQFGQEQAFNPLTNPVLHQNAGKRIRSQCRQLLDPARGNISLGLYCPRITGCDPALEAQLQGVYDDWRKGREKDPNASQAFITQYQLFSHPELTLFVYTRNGDGNITGLAGLRCLGANNGFQLDPCVAAADAARGTTDLLVIVAMQLLRHAKVSYLSMGFEPFGEIRELNGYHGLTAQVAKDAYRWVMESVHVAGKKAYYEKFRPETSMTSPLFIVMPSRSFRPLEMLAICRTANIKFSRLLASQRRPVPTSG